MVKNFLKQVVNHVDENTQLSSSSSSSPSSSRKYSNVILGYSKCAYGEYQLSLNTKAVKAYVPETIHLIVSDARRLKENEPVTAKELVTFSVYFLIISSFILQIKIDTSEEPAIICLCPKSRTKPEFPVLLICE